MSSAVSRVCSIPHWNPRMFGASFLFSRCLFPLYCRPVIGVSDFRRSRSGADFWSAVGSSARFHSSFMHFLKFIRWPHLVFTFPHFLFSCYSWRYTLRCRLQSAVIGAANGWGGGKKKQPILNWQPYIMQNKKWWQASHVAWPWEVDHYCMSWEILFFFIWIVVLVIEKKGSGVRGESFCTTLPDIKFEKGLPFMSSLWWGWQMRDNE